MFRYKYNLIMSIDIEKQIGMQVKRVLGRGSFAIVYYCIDQQSQKSYAVKVFHKKDFTKHRLKSFKKQAQILASIEHKNVVKFNSFKQTDSSLYLIMQYIPGGTLKQLITDRQQNNKKFNDGEISLILKSILQGIQYLHKFNIIHRDLKPENILVADPGDLGSIKIVDFGLSAQIQLGSPTNVKSQCGTLLYMAPQILYQPSYSKAVDIWSCAVIMYILYTGTHPIHFEGMRSQQFKDKLKTCCFPKLTHPLADNFIKNLSKIQYTQRYSVNEALRHPWITRNQQDQIPLSVNESIQSFNVSNTISDAMKFIYAVGQIYEYSCQVPLQYKNKINDFMENSQQCRIRSPSYKKNRRKVDQNLCKLKQLLNKKQKQIQQAKKIHETIQPQSPVLIKHQKLFLRLFDKQKQEVRSSTLVLEECQKIQVFNQSNYKPERQRQSIGEQEQAKSPVLISSSSYISTRNNMNSNYDIDLPLIKIGYEKKQKSGGLRKLNSLRQEVGKYQQNLSYFKNQHKNQQQKNRRTIASSKSKRVSNKMDSFNQQLLSKNNVKKPQTAERGKLSSKTKQVRPMIFGARGTFG